MINIEDISENVEYSCMSDLIPAAKIFVSEGTITVEYGFTYVGIIQCSDFEVPGAFVKKETRVFTDDKNDLECIKGSLKECGWLLIDVIGEENEQNRKTIQLL